MSLSGLAPFDGLTRAAMGLATNLLVIMLFQAKETAEAVFLSAPALSGQSCATPLFQLRTFACVIALDRLDFGHGQNNSRHTSEQIWNLYSDFMPAVKFYD